MGNVRLLLQWFLGLAMVVIILGAFLWARPAASFVGQSSRIVFFHVPQAWVAFLAFLVAAIHSGLYLKHRRIENDEAAAGAARLGIVFCVLATVTGSIFAKVMWNSYWNWDPRETSIVLLLLVYGAYLGLRGAIEEPERKATLSAAYALAAFVTVPPRLSSMPCTAMLPWLRQLAPACSSSPACAPASSVPDPLVASVPLPPSVPPASRSAPASAAKVARTAE